MFYKKGYIITVERIVIDGITEPQELYIDRCRFIVSQKINNRGDYDELIKLSHMFVNIKYYKCTYSDSIMKKIKLLQENISCD